MKQLTFIFLFLISITTLHGSEIDNYQVSSRVHNLLWKSFSLSEVKLLDSPFSRAMNSHKNYVLSLEIDRLLSNVRKNVNLMPKAEAYGGWEKSGGVTYGHYMSSCAMMYASSGDKRFIETTGLYFV